MKKIKYNSPCINANGNKYYRKIDAWETNYPGLLITRLQKNRPYSLTHAKSGLSCLFEWIYYLSDAKFIAEKYLSQFNWEQEEEKLSRNIQLQGVIKNIIDQITSSQQKGQKLWT